MTIASRTIWGIALLALAGCDGAFGGSIPATILQGCPADMKDTGIDPLCDTAFQTITDQLRQRNGSTVNWEAGSDGTGIVRVVNNDHLSGTTTKLGIEVEPRPPSDRFPTCRDGVTRVTRIELNGQVLDAFETDQMLLTILKALDKEKIGRH